MARNKLTVGVKAKVIPPLTDKLCDIDTVLVHFYNPVGHGDWYVVSYNPDTKECYGFIDDKEGYFNVDKLSEIKLPWNNTVRRDVYWQDRTVDELRQEFNYGDSN